ncbi:MAG: hypothetical protein ACR2MN_07515 [Acidimicrobiales bacterium]
MSINILTRRDRDDLAKVARMRTKVAVAGIAEQQAALLADVEAQLSAIYRFDDKAWADIVKATREMVAEADAKIAAICEERGIRPEFRPGISSGFYGRGENAIAKRRAELRKAAQTRIDAAAKRAKAAIEARSVEVQTELIAGGLSGDDARAFLATIPSADQLMPKVTVAELETGT